MTAPFVLLTWNIINDTMKYGAIRELPLQILKINKGKGKKLPLSHYRDSSPERRAFLG